MYKKVIFIMLCLSLSKGQNYKMSPILKSILVPGWGEKTLQDNKRSRFFSNIELSLWTACIGSYTFSYHQMLQYESFAVEHAGILGTEDKNHKYWVDIGNYIDIDNHNSEHLRWRYLNELYGESEQWSWDTRTNMKKFETMRIRSDYFAKASEYIIGAIVLNHIVSAIDALYLLRLNNITFIPIITNEVNEISLHITF
jgi:hypothetical protein|tara:strand:- start:3556 stop:4149 length:594 start_codon:yes stop_codon:yes gene_type:complete